MRTKNKRINKIELDAQRKMIQLCVHSVAAAIENRKFTRSHHSLWQSK